ncbi:B-box type zinc finger protein ncl-1 isoform X1 [Diorhabda carinulata]|uniref:B-box type zinc finger protein ncl-1 isoform X1 n=1 Tax=Diorhabda carinulata TaxID=1163345 RepID=UPI0025A0CB11|nr:B-box type zinc finger protein ncl-1 isoform X1 [Diorhabda carinulata]XP_057651971.1 B-box type zinc finger protein ncl-1 isoform X1 [Diorhabda carinulata]
MGTNIKEDFLQSKEYVVKTEEFEDLSEAMSDGNCKKQIEDSLLADPDNCGMCGGLLVVPRMLHCLHVFCEECLDKKLVTDGGDASSINASIICPTCCHSTLVGTKLLAALPLDVTKTNISDVSNSVTLHCTSCTAKEVAKSRCSTCHNLLCNNCDTAHHFMRCFESHKVVALDDMRKDGAKITVHKPLECDFHRGENIIYNCTTCNMTACGECVKTEHKGHKCEGILDSETRVRQEIESLLSKSKIKIEQLAKASSNLDSNLEELAHQRSSARDLINESYQSYKAVLEKCRDEILEELNKLYHERELKIMKETDELGKTINNMEDACKYTSRLLENGTIPEMMYLRKVVASRLIALNSKSPKFEKNYLVEFKSDLEKFGFVIKNNFGRFVTESDIVVKNTPTILPDLPPLNINGVTNPVPALITNGCNGPPVANSSPISLPTSLQSSIDSDIGNSLQTLMAQSPPIPHVNSNALQGFSSIAEYNLQQLATLAETNNSAATSPTATFNIADLLTNDTAYKNLASLAKLGLNAADTVPNGNNILARSTSSASINLTNNLINGFGGVSTSTSPLLSTPDDIIADPLTNIIPPTGTTNPPSIPRSNKVSPMQIRCKFGQLGPSKGQFNSPHGFCLGLEEDIIVADTNNHRIQVFEKTGTFKFQFGIPGKDEGQLWYPRKVAIMRNTGKYVVCDRGNERSRMQIFTKNGHFLKKIAIRYIDIVAGLAVTAHSEIVAVDSVSPTIFIIGESGDLHRWFDCSDYMREPSDIAIHGKEFYVCDFKGHNVVVFRDDGQFLRRIGCENLTNFPNGIDISDAGDILIGDSHGNRFHVAVFSRDGSLISEFECPYVKVSRCCGLKITSEGYVVTLAKNNHHVLVLNTLYIL